MKKSYYFKNCDRHIHINFDSGYAYYWAPSPYAEPITSNSICITDLKLYDPSDVVEIEVKLIDNNRLIGVIFEKSDNNYIISDNNYFMNVMYVYEEDIRKTIALDYYSYQFDKLGIKNYHFSNNGDLSFDDDMSHAQFVLYFGDIIR